MTLANDLPDGLTRFYKFMLRVYRPPQINKCIENPGTQAAMLISMPNEKICMYTQTNMEPNRHKRAPTKTKKDRSKYPYH